MADRYEAVVIGTGFGGAISACRVAKKWPGRVLVIERGKRYPMGSFPRKPFDMARNFWNVPAELRRRPRKMPAEEMHGLFDIRSYRHMDVVVAAGLGGGSLIYANVFLEPPDNVFDSRWPDTCKKSRLRPYFGVAREVMGSRPVPQGNDPRRQIIRTELYRQFAAEVGRSSELVDLNVFFGNDFQNPLPIGHQARNRYGALQTSCVYCAECDVGCNYHAKNTLDLNYLHVAEDRYQAEIRTQHLAQRIVPLDESGNEDPSGNGTHGYHVYVQNLNSAAEPQVVKTSRVIVSAGTLGSNELLMRCRDVFKTLPRISERLGHSYSGNGDFLSFVIEMDQPGDPNYGPVITQRIDYNLYKDFDPQRAFILEDASYPPFGAWFVEGAKPGFLHLGSMMRVIKSTFWRFVSGRSAGSVGFAFRDILDDELSYRSAVLLCMGIDKSDGKMQLDDKGCIEVAWPYRNSFPLYEAIVQAGKKFKEVFRARKFIPLPTWYWPFRRNVSVHSLGGCTLANDISKGVTNADLDHFGEVFGYRGLYVADGAILPSAVGANPTLTISALAEMVAHGITGEQPDANL